MKNFVWFCIGVITGRGLPVLWHVAYLTTIVVIFLR